MKRLLNINLDIDDCFIKCLYTEFDNQMKTEFVGKCLDGNNAPTEKWTDFVLGAICK